MARCSASPCTTALVVFLALLQGGQSSWRKLFAPRRNLLPNCEYPPFFNHSLVEQQQCTEVQEVCVDQNVFIIYDKKYLDNRFGNVRLNFGKGNDKQDWIKYANPEGDDSDPVYGMQINGGPLRQRLPTPHEYKTDLFTKFSSCTVPVVLYQNFIHNFAEFFSGAPTYLHQWSGAGTRTKALVKEGKMAAPIWSQNLTIALFSPMNLPLSEYHTALLQPYSDYKVTTLADLSSREPAGSPSESTHEKTHVTCFKKMYLCGFEPMNWPPLQETASNIVEYYKKDLDIEAVFKNTYTTGGQNTLHVLFEQRAGPTNLRQILNTQELLDQCNAYDWKDELIGTHWDKVECRSHKFGAGLAKDMAIMQETNILIALHGAGEMNALFMKKGHDSAMIEFRTEGEVWFANAWWPQAAHQTPELFKVFIAKLGEEGSWEPGAFEKLAEETQDASRLSSESYSNSHVKHRDRNARIKFTELTYSIKRAIDPAMNDHDKYIGAMKAGKCSWQFVNGTITDYPLTG